MVFVNSLWCMYTVFKYSTADVLRMMELSTYWALPILRKICHPETLTQIDSSYCIGGRSTSRCRFPLPRRHHRPPRSSRQSKAGSALSLRSTSRLELQQPDTGPICKASSRAPAPLFHRGNLRQSWQGQTPHRTGSRHRTNRGYTAFWLLERKSTRLNSSHKCASRL